ncbi:MAG: hypothetical protein HPY75_01560 [Actinobacteria bacterium]|nr:hypothetical protein [Actinomycetota bacterium]
MRKILFLTAMLIALLLAVEVGMTMLSQRGLAMALRGRYGLPEKLEARISSFPLLVSLVRNHLSELQLRWSGELAMDFDGSRDRVPYEGSARIYDAELDIPALLRGRLEFKSISRIEAAVAFEKDAVAMMMGVEERCLAFEDGRICVTEGGTKHKYRVKVLGERAIGLEEITDSCGGKGSSYESKPCIETFEFNDIPMEGFFRTASVSGDRLSIEISIPMWEGYL